MFQLTIYHNDSEAFETVEELTTRITAHGLKIGLTTYDPNWDEHILVLQGTQDQFLSWHEESMEGGPSIEVEEFLAELTPVVNLTAA
jgi:hypothetical protein